jgi:hypothetical protein
MLVQYTSGPESTGESRARGHVERRVNLAGGICIFTRRIRYIESGPEMSGPFLWSVIRVKGNPARIEGGDRVCGERKEWRVQRWLAGAADRCGS